MKNKQFTYLLGVAVVILWGIVIYKIVTATGGTDDEIVTAPVKSMKEPYNDYAIVKDTTHLLLNYRDPFGLKKQPDTSHVVIRTRQAVQVIKRSIDFSFIKYSGYIRNPQSKKIIALLIIHGKNVMLAEGQSADNVKLVKNMRDSVKVNFNGQEKFISMNPRTL